MLQTDSHKKHDKARKAQQFLVFFSRLFVAIPTGPGGPGPFGPGVAILERR
jgi:hypothetical protein